MKVGINGFGRIGRLVQRAARGTDLEVVGINDITDAKTLAHLLKYDSIHRQYPGEVAVEGDKIIIDGHKIPVFAERTPRNYRGSSSAWKLCWNAPASSRTRKML